jgi:hypothetical protein
MVTIPNPPSATPSRKGNLCPIFSYELIRLVHALEYSATGFLREPKPPTVTHTASTDPFEEVYRMLSHRQQPPGNLYFLSLDNTFEVFNI